MSALVDFQRLRVRTVEAPGGETLLMHSDVCRALGIRTTTQALDKLLPEERMTVRDVFGPRRSGGGKWLITVPAFWKLALSGKKPGAEALRTWLCSEVLPSLAAVGHYETPESLPMRAALEAEARMARLSKELSKAIQEKERKAAVEVD